MDNNKQCKLISTHYIYKGKVNLRLDALEVNNHQFSHIALEYPESVAIVPANNAKNLILIKQYRYLADSVLWEIPAGQIKKGESRKQAARRELLEETGLIAKKLVYLTQYYTNIGTSNLKVNMFLALDLEQKQQSLEPTEDIYVKIVTLQKAKKMILKGGISGIVTRN